MAYLIKLAFSEIYAAGGDPYYVADVPNLTDIEVPERLNPTDRWDGTSWVPDAALVATAAKEKLAADLAPTDPQGIRFAEELFAALKAKGYLTDADINPTALANINARRALRGQVAI